MRGRRINLGLATAALLVLLPASASAATTRTLLSDDMSNYPIGTCYAEGQTFGNFQDLFNGYGSSCIVNDGADHELDLQPEASSSSSHSALTTTTASFNRGAGYTLTVAYRTVRQLRIGSPNPWEVGWVLWNYSDNDHFYNVVLKPNGWEVDKEYVDSSGSQAQQFLASSNSPTFSVGSTIQVVVVQTVSRGVPTFVVKASVGDGRLQTLTALSDRGNSVSGRAYTSGQVGLYAEDSEAQFGSVRVTTP